jgi:hypothetical protein
MAGFVFGAGIAGGLIAWILQESTGGHLFPWNRVWSIPAALLLGGGAAFVGVYLLAATDLKQFGRTISFALLCGVFFKPVWEAGSNFIGGAFAQSKAKSTAADVRDSTDKLRDSTSSGSPEQLRAGIDQTSKSATNLIQQTAEVPDSEVRKTLDETSFDTIQTIAKAAPKSPDASVESLWKIGVAAKQTKQSDVTLHVLDSLHQIEAGNPNSPLASKARDAAADLRKPGT